MLYSLLCNVTTPGQRHLPALFTGYTQGFSQTQAQKIWLRRVQPGAVFFALAGSKTNGSVFIDQALKQGAVAVVVGQEEQQELVQLRQQLTSSASQFSSVTLFSCSSPRLLLGLMAARFFHQPCRLPQLSDPWHARLLQVSMSSWSCRLSLSLQ